MQKKFTIELEVSKPIELRRMYAKTIDIRTIYLNNKRLTFIGSKENTTIRIENFNLFKNGVDLEKDSGENRFLVVNRNVCIFSMMLARTMYKH